MDIYLEDNHTHRLSYRYHSYHDNPCQWRLYLR